MNSANSENNKVTIAGKIVTNPDFSHEVYGEKFYIFKLEVKRLSEKYSVSYDNLKNSRSNINQIVIRATCVASFSDVLSITPRKK